MTLDDVVEVLDELLDATSRGQCSVGYLCLLARRSGRLPPGMSDDLVKAAIVVGVERGFLEMGEALVAKGTPEHPLQGVTTENSWLSPLPSTDGTPWVRTTLVRVGRDGTRTRGGKKLGP